MFESLFGAEMPLAVRFFIAFLIVLGLIGAAAWAGAALRRRAVGRGRYARPPAAARCDRRSAGRRAAASDSDPARQCRTPPDDRRPERRGGRAQHRARRRRAARPAGAACAAACRGAAARRAAAGQRHLAVAAEPATRAAPRAAAGAHGCRGHRWPGRCNRTPNPAPPRVQRDTLDQSRRRTCNSIGVNARACARSRPCARAPHHSRIVKSRRPLPKRRRETEGNLADMAHRLESALRRPAPPVRSARADPVPRAQSQTMRRRAEAAPAAARRTRPAADAETRRAPKHKPAARQEHVRKPRRRNGEPVGPSTRR